MYAYLDANANEDGGADGGADGDADVGANMSRCRGMSHWKKLVGKVALRRWVVVMMNDRQPCRTEPIAKKNSA